MKYIEPDIEERIEAVQKVADKILSNKIDDDDEFEMGLRYVVSKFRNIPLWSKYFDRLTLDQLMLEVYLIRGERTGRTAPTVEESAKLLTSNPEEASKLFGDWMDDNPAQAPAIDDNLMKEAMAFMETGEFKVDEPDDEYQE